MGRRYRLILATFLGMSACSGASSRPDGGKSDAGGGDAVPVDGGALDAATTDADAGRLALCDGLPHLRLWVMVEPGNELRGSLVRVENGMPVLTVDGTCSYWVGGGWSEDPLGRDRPFRTGTLSAADVSTLEGSLPLDDVGALGDCPPPPPGDYDYGVQVIRTASAEAVCKTTGTRFDAAWTTVQELAAALWENGTPMDGALHVSAVDAPSSASNLPAPYAWPTALPLTSFILNDAVQYQTGVSLLVDDPVAAGQLRAVRDQYLSDRTAQPGLYTSWDGLEVTDQTVTALVYMRDAIPYEDAQGLLTF